jgi:hypothetical protein
MARPLKIKKIAVPDNFNPERHVFIEGRWYTMCSEADKDVYHTQFGLEINWSFSTVDPEETQ